VVLETLESAKNQLEKNLRGDLIPQEGMSFGYAIRGARDGGGIAAIEGGVHLSEGDIPAGGPCVFGSDEEISRIILTAMKFDPRVRSAAILAYSSRAKEVLRDDMFLASVSCESPVQPGTSTMDWGIASCCKKGVPDVIFYREMDANRSRIIIFGEEPVDVLNNIIMCSNRI
jgi:hydroxymethylpyrimidine/phosphomethylpyrimidine kinase